MKTKFKLLISILVIAFGLQSCSDIYDNLDLIEANSRVIATSQMNFDNTVRVGGSITFGDISSGVVSRLWTFPEGAADIENADNDITATTENVKAFFNVPGTYDVTLHQVFKGEAYDLDSPNPIGKELDTTIVVTVLPKIKTVLKGYALNADGSEGAALNLTSGAKNEITAGRMARYIIESVEGAPANIAWTTGATTANLSDDKRTIDVVYKKTGNYGLELFANTARPAGEERTIFTDLITVIPSTDPVTLDRVFEKDGQTIGLEFSREMDPATINKNDFSVSIQTAGGAVLVPDPSAVTVDAAEGNIVLVSLGEPYYNNDTVKISYTPGVLSTLDGVNATAFTDAVLTDIIKTNILANSAYDYSFETSADATWQNLGWAGFTDYTRQISTNKAKDGAKSLYVEMAAGGGMIMGHRDSGGNFIRFTTKANTLYEIGAWVYVTDLGNATGANPPDLRFYWNPGTDWGIGSAADFTANFPTNTWVYVSFRTSKFAAGDTSFMIRGFNAPNTAPLKFYMDDITVAELNLRP
ncbi:hypothetical protein [Thalassobellus suaedae]|uniref:PKD domain-containing protein n=1 Tax=Thalassobellus suaedae TaxID=3074124 RepID=A0ABY9Y232_9FLAO|nr:hypothetical protein RHP49_13720 [Flavobacteriaceae bacterium HL-DH10]